MFNKINKKTYESLYKSRKVHLEYPQNWVIQFWVSYLKEHIKCGKLLDFGCGSGNNSIFFINKMYDVYGCDVAENFKECVKDLLKKYQINENIINKFTLLDKNYKRLPYDDNTFDVIVANQVLYYLPSREAIIQTCNELKRVLKPNGVIYISMMGQKNYYFTKHTKKILTDDGHQHEVKITDKTHRLYGLHEVVYFMRSEQEMEELFGMFKKIDIGSFEIKMLDTDGHHWVFIGKKDI